VHLPDAGIPDDLSDNARLLSVSFAVPATVVMAKFGAVALLAVAALLAPSRSQVAVGLLAAAGIGAYAVRDITARVRVAADTSGVRVVHGYAGRRRLRWPQIENVRVDTRTRMGVRTELLEIDTGEEIFLYSRFDLGVEPARAEAALRALRRS
jgi:hypothetical protein